MRTVRTADSIELCGIQLLPEVQRRGIGTAIVADLMAQAAAASLPLELSVEKDNPDAGKLYHRLGFIPIGETEDEYRLRFNPGRNPETPAARVARAAWRPARWVRNGCRRGARCARAREPGFGRSGCPSR